MKRFGSYAHIRHPGYISGSLMYVAIGLCLGSYWALVPALLSAVVFLIRTILEDSMLSDELPGYREYAERVRFRWLPGVW